MAFPQHNSLTKYHWRSYCYERSLWIMSQHAFLSALHSIILLSFFHSFFPHFLLSLSHPFRKHFVCLCHKDIIPTTIQIDCQQVPTSSDQETTLLAYNQPINTKVGLTSNKQLKLRSSQSCTESFDEFISILAFIEDQAKENCEKEHNARICS